MENKLTEQEIQRILKNYERELEQYATKLMQQTLDRVRFILLHGRKPLVGASSWSPAWLHGERMEGLDGMITQDFYDFFDFLCKENGVETLWTKTSLRQMRTRLYHYW